MRQLCKAEDLVPAHHLVRYEYISDPGFDHDFSFAKLLACYSFAASCYLLVSYCGALVGLDMRSQLGCPTSEKVSHLLDISLQNVQVQQENGGVKVFDPSAPFRGQSGSVICESQSES